MSLTVEEVMHIRQVLVKAELEKFQQYKDIYNALKKGKVGMKHCLYNGQQISSTFQMSHEENNSDLKKKKVNRSNFSQS